ncbi:AraC family transcriptional regulator [Alteromonas sp. SM 2104]|nr:AraC family transcriptional regulator [Alteromonas oceanisediminis]
MDSLSHLLATLKVTANVFHNGQYCGNWAVDTSGSHYISFHAVSHGRCYVKSIDEAEVHTLSVGDVVIFPRDAKHVITSDADFTQPVNTEQSVDFNTLERNGTGLVCGYFEHHHPMIASITEFLPTVIVIKRSDHQQSALALLTQTLLTESVHQADGAMLILSRLSECILALIFRDYLQVEKGILAALANPKLAPAIKSIFAAPAQKWTVDTLAETCFISRTAFATLFKQTLGISPIDFATQWRLGLAYRQLADDNVSTLAAALECGYESEASFSKAFKRVFGVSPGSIRAQVKT